MSESDEGSSPPPVPDMNAKEKVVVRQAIVVRDSAAPIKYGYVAMIFGLLIILIAAVDDGPDTDDFDDMDDYLDASESYDTRTNLYGGLTVISLLGGVIMISGGLLIHGLNEYAEMHHYVRIAVIVGGVFILGLFISGIFDFMSLL